MGLGALSCQVDGLGLGAGPEDHAMNPMVQCSGGKASIDPASHANACPTGDAAGDGASLSTGMA